MSSSSNSYCTCSTLPTLSDSAETNLSYKIIEQNTIIGPKTIDETYKMGFKEGFNYGCAPNVGCIDELCLEACMPKSCIEKSCTGGGCSNPCKPFGNCKICTPKICTPKICTPEFCSGDVIPNCTPKICTDDICLQGSIEFTNLLKLYFDYEIITITKEVIDPITKTIYISYEQQLLLSNMYFKGKIKYEETLSNIPTVSYSAVLTLNVDNPTTLYCLTSVEPTDTTFTCGGCVLITEESLSTSLVIEGIGFEMSIGQPTIGICKTTGSDAGTYYNISAVVETKMIIPGVTNPTLSANAVYSQKLA